MNQFMKFIYVLVGVIFLASCAPRIKHSHGKPPHAKVKVKKSKNMHAPGQIKKVTGSKSARPYAPGQVKKHPSKKHHPKKHKKAKH